MSNFSFPSESYGLLLLSQDRLIVLWQIQWLFVYRNKSKEVEVEQGKHYSAFRVGYNLLC